MQESIGPRQRVSRFHLRLFKLAIIIFLLLMLVGFAEITLRLVGFSHPLYPEKVDFGSPRNDEVALGFDADPDCFWIPPEYKDHLKATGGQIDTVFMGCSC